MWVLNHILDSILIFFGYLILGTLYSMLKWAIFVSDGKNRIMRFGYEYRANDWKPSTYKSKITHWAIFWPLSGIWTLISNPIVKAFNRIFYEFESVYQKISDNIMRNLIEKQKNKKITNNNK